MDRVMKGTKTTIYKSPDCRAAEVHWNGCLCRPGVDVPGWTSAAPWRLRALAYPWCRMLCLGAGRGIRGRMRTAWASLPLCRLHFGYDMRMLSAVLRPERPA